MSTMTDSTPTPADRLAGMADRHHAAIWRYLRLLGADAETADDLAQDAFVRLIRRPPDDLDEPRAVWAYLREIARNLYVDRIRWRRRRREVESVEIADRVWDEYSEPDGGEAYLRHLRSCLGETTPRVRRSIELRYRDGLDRKSLALALGLSENGAKTLLQRARAALRACIERKLETERSRTP